MEYPVTIVQVFRVEREITVKIEAASPEEAVEIQELREAPSWNEGWKSTWNLMNEEVLVHE